ncbi:MAG TPA: hypothetical protein PKE39_07730 [Ignavibacteria bacterium]|nr:hypothetical protein [Ignavibacteria bacterium]HMQ98901.1 hypothetical protein [Ignavibacteria bacterium]
MNNIENHNFVLESVIVKEDDGYYSLCLDVDVASQGDTIEEAKSMLIEAVEGYIEVSVDMGLPFLRPVPDHANPEIIEPENIMERFTIHYKAA